MRLSRAGQLLVPGWNCFGVRSVPGVKCGTVGWVQRHLWDRTFGLTGELCKLQDTFSNPQPSRTP